jgi:hypothetical protein
LVTDTLTDRKNRAIVFLAFQVKLPTMLDTVHAQ